MKNSPILLASQYFINNQLPRNGRGLTRRPFPYNGITPLVLRNRVANKQYVKGEESCIEEMNALLNCLKANNFQEQLCIKQTNILASCHENYVIKKAKKEEEQKSNIPVPGSKNLTSAQLNYLMTKYPHQLPKK